MNFILRRIIVISLLFTAFSAYADSEKMRIAIFDPVIYDNNLGEGAKVTVREIIGSWMVNNGNFTILERSMLQKVMEEQKFSNSDAVDETQASELGKLAGASKVMLTVISRANDKDLISIKYIDVETASVEHQQIKIVKSEDVFNKIKPMLGKMFKDLKGNGKSSNKLFNSLLDKLKK